MSDAKFQHAVSQIEASVAALAPRMQTDGPRPQMDAQFLSGLAVLLLKAFLAALTEEALKEAAKAGVDVVKWVVGKIRAYLSEATNPADGDMSIQPHFPSLGGGTPKSAEAEATIYAALCQFLPAADARTLAASVRKAAETHMG